MAEEELQVEEDKAAKGSNNLIVIIAAVLLGLGAGAIGVYFFLGGGEPAEPSPEEVAAAAAPPKTLYYKIEKPFIFNVLGSKGRQHDMKLDVHVRGKSQEALDTIKEHEPAVRSKLSTLFRGQKVRELQTEAGFVKLNEDATAAVQAFLQEKIGEPGIEQVLFSNSVMQ